MVTLTNSAKFNITASIVRDSPRGARQPSEAGAEEEERGELGDCPWLGEEEVVHGDDVHTSIRDAERRVTRGDSRRRDPPLARVEQDAAEGLVTNRGRNRQGCYQIVGGVEELARGGPGVDIGENRAEVGDRRRDCPVWSPGSRSRLP